MQRELADERVGDTPFAGFERCGYEASNSASVAQLVLNKVSSADVDTLVSVRALTKRPTDGGNGRTCARRHGVRPEGPAKTRTWSWSCHARRREKARHVSGQRHARVEDINWHPLFIAITSGPTKGSCPWLPRNPNQCEAEYHQARWCACHCAQHLPRHGSFR